MAANKFATMLHRNTNKLTLILIYAVLEWILIILLLLNSLFSYLIIKFADYFGLTPPCLLCSRLDHFFDPKKKSTDLLCEFHSNEISQMGYCSNHRKLAESQHMCEECSSSTPQSLKNRSFLEEIDENGFKCSCCGVNFERQIQSLWSVFDYTHKENLMIKEDQIGEGDDSDLIGLDFEGKGEDRMVSDSEVLDWSVFVSHNSGLRELEEEKEEKSNLIIEDEKTNGIDASIEILPQHLEFFVGHGGHRLIPVELIDSATEENHLRYRIREVNEDDDEAELSALEIKEEAKFAVIESMEMEENETSVIFHAKECNLVREVYEHVEQHQTTSKDVCDGQEIAAKEVGERDFDVPAVTEEVFQMPMNEHVEQPQITSNDVYVDQEIVAKEAEERDLDVPAVKEEAFPVPINEYVEPQIISKEETKAAEAEAEERDSDVPAVTEEAFQIPINETEAEVSIGTEIPDLEQTDEFQNQEILAPYASTNEEEDRACGQAEEESVEFKTMSVEVREVAVNHQSSLGSELNEIEEEKVLPDTPTSTESLHHLHKKLLLLEKKESGTEESFDGSVISDFECGDGVITTERLTSALRAERKALHALYTELEEERSASAVAASQTMAMINRLQEEKAAMQMEALQYQRMMEEQSEYDQEALQLLNELMMKREREKQELEKELEVYRKKVLVYEAKERMKKMRKSKDGSTSSESCSASSSNGGDSDGLSIDLNQEAKELEDNFDDRENGNHNTPVDAVLNLEESLANFEEERLSILEQLKVLEDKLFTMTDEEEQCFEDVKPIEHFYKENGIHCEEVNGVENGFPMEMNGNGKHHQEGRIIGAKGKRLLPLFDAIIAENEDSLENGHVNGFDSDLLQSSVVKRIEMENKKVTIEEEVDNLYQRLQALEADREFLKHCISSLKKGDKGMDLLQEILQHLRDLKNVELQVKNLSDCALISHCA